MLVFNHTTSEKELCKELDLDNREPSAITLLAIFSETGNTQDANTLGSVDLR